MRLGLDPGSFPAQDDLQHGPHGDLFLRTFATPDFGDWAFSGLSAGAVVS
jgi:hypothetical protein